MKVVRICLISRIIKTLWASFAVDWLLPRGLSGPIWCSAYAPRQKRAYRMTCADFTHSRGHGVASPKFAARGYRACGQAGRFDPYGVILSGKADIACTSKTCYRFDMDDIKILRRAIKYDPATGGMTWRARGRWVVESGFQGNRERLIFNRKWAGRSCLTTLDKDGYFSGWVLGRFYRAHRVAYAVSYGMWPAETIDHKNRIRTDNRLTNLRDATRAEQQANRGRQVNNKSGVSGVHYDANARKWIARETVSGKRVFLGAFSQKHEAIAAKRNFAS